MEVINQRSTINTVTGEKNASALGVRCRTMKPSEFEGNTQNDESLSLFQLLCRREFMFTMINWLKEFWFAF